MNLRFLFFAFLVSILSSPESLAGRNHSVHSASAEVQRAELSVWTASPQRLNKETLFFLMIQLAETPELLHSSENSGFFNPLIYQRLVVKPSLLPARSVELKTTSVRGYTISLGKHSGDFDFFRKSRKCGGF